MLSNRPTICVMRRFNVLKKLFETTGDIDSARETEGAIHCISRNEEEYINKAQQLVINLKQNKDLILFGTDIVVKTDCEMAKNTIIEDIQHEDERRKLKFGQMLEEKYEMLNDKSYKETLKCARCGSGEVSWEQKQTRSADEAMTVYCTCNKCNKRWTMK